MPRVVFTPNRHGHIECPEAAVEGAAAVLAAVFVE